jgi:hydrogenase maturation protease
VVDVLVVGIGNRLRGDDGAGPAVAERVREQLGDGVLVVEHDGEPAALLDLLSRARVAVLVDAAQQGTPPGTCTRIDAGAGPLPAAIGAVSTHGVGLAEAIELGRALGRLPPALDVVCVEGDSYGIGDGLSPAVAAAIGPAADEVRAALRVRLGAPAAERTASGSRPGMSAADT